MNILRTIQFITQTIFYITFEKQNNNKKVGYKIQRIVAFFLIKAKHIYIIYSTFMVCHIGLYL